ncbi:diacylglycerol/polyprenol kinase family protein [Chloroflexota bacterium]
MKPLLREYETSRLTEASYMIAASLTSFLVFERDIALLAICFLAMGDALAAIASKYLSSKRPPGKTLRGNLACFISCAVIGLVFYYAGFGVHWVTVLVGAIVATIVEAMPIPINDNLTIPLIAGLAMTLIPL